MNNSRRRNATVIFDTAGSYFVDVFYNHLYAKAVELANVGGAGSITEAYEITVRRYAYSAKHNAENYKKIIKSLHEYYCMHMNIQPGFGAFEDMFISQFLYEEYFSHLDQQRKDGLLNAIILQTIASMAAHVSKRDVLSRIIDDHGNSINVIMMQETAVELFNTQKEELQEKFATIWREGAEAGKIKRISAKLAQETERRIKAESDRDKALIEIHRLMTVSKTQQATVIAGLEPELARLRFENQNLLDQCDRLKGEYKNQQTYSENLKSENLRLSSDISRISMELQTQQSMVKQLQHQQSMMQNIDAQRNNMVGSADYLSTPQKSFGSVDKPPAEEVQFSHQNENNDECIFVGVDETGSDISDF